MNSRESGVKERKGHTSNITCFTKSTPELLPETAATYCITSLEASVLPAPDSPLRE